jgi:hypothetical protein
LGIGSGGSVILVDDAAEYLAPPDRQVGWDGDLAVVVGWSLLAGLVRAVLVVRRAAQSISAGCKPGTAERGLFDALAEGGLPATRDRTQPEAGS